MGFIGGIYSGINSFMLFLINGVFGICAELPLLVNLIVFPVSFIVLLALGLFLMAWPLWAPVIIYVVARIPVERRKSAAEAERLRAAAERISDKTAAYLRANRPGLAVEEVMLYRDSLYIVASAGPAFFVGFGSDLNLDVSGLPQGDVFFRYLAEGLIAKYPLPGYQYYKHTRTVQGKDEVVGYNYTHTADRGSETSGQVRLSPIMRSGSAEFTTHSIVKIAPVKAAPTKEVL